MAAGSDQSERTFPPTAIQLERARRRGQVARSGDLAAPVGVLAAAGALWLTGPVLLSASREMLAGCLESAWQAGGISAAMFVRPALLAGLVCAVGALAAAAAQWVQVGWMFNAAPVAVDWSRVGFGANLRQTWSRRGVVRLVFAGAKLLVVGAVMWRSLPEWLVQLGRPDASLADLAASTGGALLNLAAWLAGLLGALALADWAYQRWEHHQDLRMSRRDWLDDVQRMSRRAARPAARQEAT